MFVKFSLPELSLKKQMFSPWEFHGNKSSKSSSTNDMIIGQSRDLFGKFGVIINFDDQIFTWGAETIPIMDRNKTIYQQQRS
jgi:hypothetical protein